MRIDMFIERSVALSLKKKKKLCFQRNGFKPWQHHPLDTLAL